MKYYVLIRNNKGIYVKGFKRKFISYYMCIVINKIKRNEVEHGKI